MIPSTLLALVLAIIAPTPASADDDTVSSNSRSLQWGPFRPNLYLGLRPRIPKSVIAGLMWGRLEDIETTLRHNVNQSEGMARYGWTAYDTREGGRQVIEDVGNKINITTEFIKYSEGQSQGNWGLRIKGTPRPDAPPELKTTVIFYVGMEEKGACTSCRLDARQQPGDGDDKSVQAVNMNLVHPSLGTAGIHIPIPLNSDGHREISYVKSLNVTEDHLWHAKSKRAMTSTALTADLKISMQTFGKNFLSVFNPNPPFKTFPHLTFSKSVFSDLLGGLGYFAGTSKVGTSKKAIFAETTGNFWEKSEDAKKHTTPETKGPYELLTHTPSRSMFPRGFLWDEGFHLLMVIEWDADLALEVIRDWLFLMDDDGWIAREQILGIEAEAATPPEFITQYPHIANPPTMYLVISKFIKMLKGTIPYHGRESVYISKPETGKALVTKMQPLLKRHYEWFRKSQSGDIEAHSLPSANLNEGYRWRGRTPENNLASGLDDYPRAEPPDITELHLDALCWVGVMARTLEHVAFFTEDAHDAMTYQNHVRGIKKNLDIIHWAENLQLYCDTVVREDMHVYECHKGYISIFPLITGFIDASHAHLPAILDLLRDPKHLWTDYGIRSLSPEDKHYGVGDNYWRSPIWININYLVLDRLLGLAETTGPEQQRCRQIYTELRRNLVQTVFNDYLRTGFIWEQYEPGGGHGQRTQHFTGWTALVVKIMAMPDLETGEGMKEQVKGYYEEARKQAAQHPRTGAGGLLFAIAFMAFIYVTRRRFAGTLRTWRKSK
ncbi:glycoside hydrolase family 63 protein [Stemphylium lycopersici]|nr:glycoside hydrolase family 63 protein [Stemphylium lycopersici]